MDQARALREALRYLVVAHGAQEPQRRPCGAALSLPHAYALLELLQNNGTLTVTELAARLNIDRTNVSRLCARMEGEGQLTRTPDPRDRRARRLELTLKGHRLAQQIDISSAQHFQTLLQHLDADSHSVVQALNQLRAAMEAVPPSQADVDSPEIEP